jgi:hypothetical protein
MGRFRLKSFKLLKDCQFIFTENHSKFQTFKFKDNKVLNFIGSFKSHDLRLEVSESDVSLCFLPLSHIFERAWTFYLLHCGAVNCFLSNPKKVIDVLPIVT